MNNDDTLSLALDKDSMRDDSQKTDRPTPPPKWSRAAESLDLSGAAGSANKADKGRVGDAQAGAWIWLPQGPGPKTPWRKRHPILFWGGLILLFALVFGWGRMSVEDGLMPGAKIAVVNVEGIILDAGQLVTWMDKVLRDDSYKGAVVRINSPGGAVGPSQEIYAAIKRLAKVKPVVASMGALAASGGYYAALGADHIVAGPASLTASIGVKMQIPNIGALMQSLGISEKTLATGNLKDAGSSWRDMLPEEEAYFRALLDDMYAEFIETVAKERDLPLEKVRELADGRAMTGRQALAAGLVDELGDLHRAAVLVRERAQLAPGEARLEEGPPKPASWLNDYLGVMLNSLLRQHMSVQPLFYY
ncbi:signal peptide peptidase SppA [Desulfovibrio sp. OttesenSCG-928-M14]|nr:signal peptide peptidase SppA [Desulfovibrio sp. OttesenSCG-928-M14]